MKDAHKILLVLLLTGMFFGRADGALLNSAPAVASTSMSMEMPHETMPEAANQFRRIEKPLGIKIAVTAGGLALIGLELWWFLFSRPKLKKQIDG